MDPTYRHFRRWVIDSDGATVLEVPLRIADAEASASALARRAALALNAVEGVSDAALEADAVHRLIGSCSCVEAALDAVVSLRASREIRSVLELLRGS